MGDKNVKIEYQFTAKDNGLTDTVDVINKKLDELGDKASSTTKKVSGLDKETKDLSSTLGTADIKADSFNKELEEMQKELKEATADVERLNEALKKQQKIMASFNTNSNGMVKSQGEINKLAEQTTQQLNKVAKLQNRINANGINFKNIPKVGQLQSDLNKVNKQLQDANKLSNQLSIQPSTKRNLSFDDTRKTPWSQKAWAQVYPSSTYKSEDNRDLKKLAAKYPEFKALHDEVKAANDIMKKHDKISGEYYRQLEELESKKDSMKYRDYANIRDEIKSKESAHRIESIKADREKIGRKSLIKRKMEAMDYKRYLSDDAPDEYIHPAPKKRRTLNTPNLNDKTATSSIKAETKAIEANTKAKINNNQLSPKSVKRNDEITVDKSDTGYVKRLKWEGYKPEDFEQLRTNAKYLIGTDKLDSISRLRYDLENFTTEDAILNISSQKIDDLKKQIDSNKFSGNELKTIKSQYDEELDYYNRIKENAAHTLTEINDLVNMYEDVQKELGVEDSLLNQPYSKDNVDNFLKRYKEENPDDYNDYYKKWEDMHKETKAIESNTKEVDNLTSKINSKAVELKSAIDNNDTALVGQLRGEVKDLLSQRQALEKLKGKTLTTNNKLKSADNNNSIMSNVAESTRQLQQSNYQNATQETNALIQQQAAIEKANVEASKNMLKAAQLNNKTAKSQEKTAKANRKTANKESKNIENNIKAEKLKTLEVAERVKLYEDSRERGYESDRKHAQQKRQDGVNFKNRQAYNKAVENAPDDLKNLINDYKYINADLKDRNNKMEAFNTSIDEKIAQNYLKKEDYDKLEKTSLGHTKKLFEASKKIEKLNQKAEKILTITGNEASKLINANLTKGADNKKIAGRVYRNKNKNMTLSGNTGKLEAVKQYKTLIDDLYESETELRDTMGVISNTSVESGSKLLKFKTNMNSVGNTVKGYGDDIINIGDGIGKLGNGFIKAGQSLDNLSNSMRGFSLAATSAFALAGKQGIEYDKSIQGIAAAIDRTIINEDGSVSRMDDNTFNALLDKMSTTAREQARNSVYDANEIAEAYRYTTLAGWTGEESMATMQSLIDYATAGRIDGSQFAGMIDDIANSLASLGMVYEGIDLDGDGVFDERVRKNADDMAQSVTRLTDVMSKAQAISTLDPEDLIESYKIGGSQLTSFGLTLEEITAMYSVLGNRGIKGSKAANGLSSIMANLTGKTGQAKKALDELKQKTGVDVYAWDKNGQYIGIDNHLEKLSEAFTVLKEKYGTEYGVDNLQLSQLLGGKHHFKSLTKLLEGYQSGEYSNTLITLQNSSGATSEMADIADDSVWAQLKMTLSEVKEAMLSLWEVIEPTFLKLLELVKGVARAFTNLSDEQKMAIAKFAAIVIVATVFTAVLAGLITIFGTVLTAVSSLASGLGTLVLAIGSAIMAGGGFKGFVGYFIALSPALKSTISLFSKLIATLGGFKNMAVVFASIGTCLKLLNFVRKGFRDASRESDGFWSTLKNGISNTGGQLEHYFMNLGEKITSFFKIDVSKISSQFAKLASTIIKIMDNMFNLLTGGSMGKIFGFIGKKTGTDGLKEHILGRLDNTAKNGKSKEEFFASSLDKKAQAQGYKNYEAMEKANNREALLDNTVKVLNYVFDGEETGAFSALMGKIDEAQDTKINLTIEDIKSDAASYRDLTESIAKDKKNIIKLETDIEISEDKIKKYNKQLQELKEKINSTNNSDKKKQLEAQYNEIKEKRDVEIDTRISNQEQLQSTMDNLTKKEEKELVIKTTYEENGKKEELEYESKKGEFEKEHGSKLSYVNYEKDKATAEGYLASIPDMKKQLQLKLETTTDPSEYNEIYFMIEKLEEMETNIPVYLELIEQQKIVDDTKEKMTQLNEEIEAKKEEQNTILKRTGLKAEELAGEDAKAYENAGKIIKEKQEEYDKTLQEHKAAETEIEGLNGGDLQPIYDLWENLYSNYDKPAIKLFDDKEIALLEKLGIIKPTQAKTPEKPQTPEGYTTKVNVPKGYEATEEEITVNTPVSNKDTITFGEKEEKKPEKPKTPTKKQGGEGVSSTYIPSEEPVEIINFNTDSTNGNTEAVNNNTTAVNTNKEAVQQQGQAIEELSGKEIDSSGVETFGEKVANTSEEVNGNIDNLKEKMAEISESLSGIDLTGITEVFTLVYTSVTEAREALSGIAGFAVNTGLSSFTTMAEGLKTGIEQARTSLMNVAGVANNYGSQALTNMGNSLTDALSGARDKVLSVANVALNYGQNAMSSMGGALVSALSTAEGIVSRIAGQISTIKTEISNIKMPSAPSSVDPSAPSAVASIANNPATMSALRTITNNSVSNSIANTSNFNFNMSGLNIGSRQDARNTAKILTTHLKRRGL